MASSSSTSRIRVLTPPQGYPSHPSFADPPQHAELARSAGKPYKVVPFCIQTVRLRRNTAAAQRGHKSVSIRKLPTRDNNPQLSRLNTEHYTDRSDTQFRLHTNVNFHKINVYSF
jgi:hypothetical protein